MTLTLAALESHVRFLRLNGANPVAVHLGPIAAVEVLAMLNGSLDRDPARLAPGSCARCTVLELDVYVWEDAPPRTFEVRPRRTWEPLAEVPPGFNPG